MSCMARRGGGDLAGSFVRGNGGFSWAPPFAELSNSANCQPGSCGSASCSCSLFCLLRRVCSRFCTIIARYKNCLPGASIALLRLVNMLLSLCKKKIQDYVVTCEYVLSLRKQNSRLCGEVCSMSCFAELMIPSDAVGHGYHQ